MLFDPERRRRKKPGRIPERSEWEEYTRRKRQLELKDMDPDDYERACQNISAELGL